MVESDMENAALQGRPPHHHPVLPPARCERGAPVKAPMRREWPADYWDELLALRGLPERCRRTAQQ